MNSDKINTVAVIDKITLPAGNYFGTYSSKVVRIWSYRKNQEPIWTKALSGIRGTVNCLVKVDIDGSAIVVY